VQVKKLFGAFTALICLGACSHDKRPVVDAALIDSLINYYTPPAMAVINRRELGFWSSRINPSSPGFLNESKYAGCLMTAFRLFGDIDSLKKSDSVLEKIDRDYHHREASVQMAMSAHCISEHRFMEADSLLQQARRLGLRPYETLVASFDVDFELGRYPMAKTELNGIRSTNDFSYYFRRSKMDHLDGELDSSIHDMVRAAGLTAGNDYLKGVALANAGDLYLHAGDLSGAGNAYLECIRMNNADFHSWMGLGWIALSHDGNPILAEKIFRWVQSKMGLPDPLFRLAQTAAVRRDSTFERDAARAFVRQAEEPVYGRMYNKYLIQLYTGILQEPGRAEWLARDELNNRATPQTYAWYAWALLANHKKDQAYAVYREHVSGQPLEALELYWMGRLMESLNKNYNAREFYRAAAGTRYDLDPADAGYVLARLED